MGCRDGGANVTVVESREWNSEGGEAVRRKVSKRDGGADAQTARHCEV